jgi:hypothetical protein
MAKFLIYLTTSIFLGYIIRDTNFSHWTLGGKGTNIELFNDYPCLDIPDYLREFYVMKLGYFSHEMLYTLIYNTHKPEFSEIILHHFVTNVLVFFSYSTNFLKSGALVMLLHGISDIFVSNMKMMYEFSSERMTRVWYFLMLFSFVYTRVIVFPFVVMMQIYEKGMESPIAQ